ncbi:MAG: MMPL family transporter [Nitrospira sp.]|nr:MMPL family transporter [Nitrospira sp.]
MAQLFASTGRALFFNFAAMSLGFGMLATSAVPPLIRFGSLVAVAMAASFLASITVMPALAKLLRPRFLGFETPAQEAPQAVQLNPVLSGSPIKEGR